MCMENWIGKPISNVNRVSLYLFTNALLEKFKLHIHISVHLINILTMCRQIVHSFMLGRALIFLKLQDFQHKMKEKKRDKYLDLVSELTKTMEYKCDVDTNCN